MTTAERPSPTAPRSTARRALWAMTAREIRELGASFRFRVTVTLTLSLMILSAIVGVLRHRAETQTYDLLEREYREAVAGEPLWRLLDFTHPVVKPPWKLAVLSEGRQRWTPQIYRSTLNVWIDPVLARHDNAWPGFGTREPLDWTFVLRVVLSMAAFVLGYDAVCGSRQKRELKMMLSYPILRWQVVAAKLLAVWTCVATPFVLGAVASLLLLSAFGGLGLSNTDLIKASLLIAVSLWASGFFAALAVWVSILAREPARSLAILALLWVTAVVVLPGAGGLLAQAVRPLPTDQEATRAVLDIGDEVHKFHDGPGLFRPPWEATPSDYPEMRKTAVIQNDRYRQQEQARRQRIRDELAQVELAQNLASFSPMFLVQNLAERLIGSGLPRDRAFVEQAWSFGDRLAARVQELDDMDPESPRLWKKLDLWGTEGLYARLLPLFLSECTVEPEDLPHFVFRELSPGEGLRAATPRLALFGLVTALLLLLLRSASRSFDIGGPVVGRSGR